MGDNRLTRITTRTGDDGSTGLADGTRLPKTDARVIAMSAVDELNSRIGSLCVSPGLDPAVLARLRDVQHDLFDLGGELSLPGMTVLNRAALTALESDIQMWNAGLPPLKEFVLPGSDETNARAHLARTACRQTELWLWQLCANPKTAVAQDDTHALTADTSAPCSIDLPRYLNRLSDWLFVLARHLALQNGGSEVVWRRGEQG